jgi:hypothetical protein
MNRGSMGIGISITVIILVFVVIGFFGRNVMADGSPKVLKPVTDDMAAKIEAAIPEKATAKPAKARKILVFWL